MSSLDNIRFGLPPTSTGVRCVPPCSFIHQGWVRESIQHLSLCHHVAPWIREWALRQRKKRIDGEAGMGLR